ncbi:MAG: adenylate kinase [Atopostipes sp.]|nr:adenylate kinase [Staphylococcus equorum]MDN6161231.1 adenylate kinase [Atopostipes sp.]
MDLILLGLPGSGKGTQAEYISDHYAVTHISTGDIFRSALKNETSLGLKAKKYMDSGDLVPDQLTNNIVKERLQEDDVKEGFLLDGYPRTLVQSKALKENLKELNRKIDTVIYLDVPEKVLFERLTGRYICSNCGATYHKVFNPTKIDGVCDNCGATEFYQRDDDKKETVKKRIEVNRRQTEKLIEFYKKEDTLIEINGDQKPEKVFDEIKKSLDV